MKTTDDMVLFWNGIYSNWYKSDMFVENYITDGETVTFNCVEQYMMYSKAVVFNDRDTRKLIMKTSNPSAQKKLGRKVSNFNASHWDDICMDIVFDGVLAKFEQHSQLREQLLGTGDRIIAEASPLDKIWGIGLHENDPRCLDVETWQGTNYLGEVLMDVRTHLTS